jgi:UDP:flavonoid glycosyltransferase YjiC (YdhE family)
MKVLLASLAVDGHFNPLTGIAVQLKQSGDDVRWYTGTRYAGRLAGLGIVHYAFRRAVEHSPENLHELYPERARLTGPRAISFDAETIFASNVGNFIDDLADIRAEFDFDVLVVDVAMLVQRIAIESLDVPVVSVVPIANMQSDPIVPPMAFGLKPASSWLGRMRDLVLRVVSARLVLASARRRYASILADRGVSVPKSSSLFDEPYLTSAAVIQSGTASFDFPRSTVNPRVHYVGPLLPYSDAEFTPLPFADRFGRYATTVLVTQGTVDNRDQHKLIIPAIEALVDTDTLVLVATGRWASEELRRRYCADNVVIEDYIDFAAVLNHVDVFVTNGGFGGVMLSLAHGVPIVCAGINEGKSDVNAHVDYHRVGVNLGTQKPKPAAIRRAVQRVAAEPAWTARAQAFRAELAAYDPPEIAERLIHNVALSTRTSSESGPRSNRQATHGPRT